MLQPTRLIGYEIILYAVTITWKSHPDFMPKYKNGKVDIRLPVSYFMLYFFFLDSACVLLFLLFSLKKWAVAERYPPPPSELPRLCLYCSCKYDHWSKLIDALHNISIIFAAFRNRPTATVVNLLLARVMDNPLNQTREHKTRKRVDACCSLIKCTTIVCGHRVL